MRDSGLHVLVAMCKHCRWILEEGDFYPAYRKNGEPNPYCGKCANCGGTDIIEGTMGRRERVRYSWGWFNPVILQIGGVRVEDPFKELAPRHFFFGSIFKGKRLWSRKSPKEVCT